MLILVLKRVIGIILLIIGVVALVTPLTPGAAFLIFVGMELLGIGFLIPGGLRKYWERVKSRITRRGEDANM